MLNEILQGLREFIGIGNEQENLAFWQMALRGIIIYITAVALVRVGEKRFMGKNTAFDVILGIILGSVLSRAITGNAPFLPTVAVGVVLVTLHWFFSVIAFHSDRFGTILKGSKRKLVENGKIDWNNMRKSHIGENDLMGALRSNGQISSIDEVEVAHFERSGDISVIKREKTPRIIEISIREGVQTVRLEMT